MRVLLFCLYSIWQVHFVAKLQRKNNNLTEEQKY